MVGRCGLFPAARGQLTQLDLFPTTYDSHINLSISLPTPISSPWPKLEPGEPPKGGTIQRIRVCFTKRRQAVTDNEQTKTPRRANANV
ncbi:hypothetical protein RRF57_013321 [Xylaria bambusicola]|uniref:Uncharacterized protein n=1 Tax=Xylaria bambusicola TaxID=326684 RepID=A0AAN7V2P9_9PEZI